MRNVYWLQDNKWIILVFLSGALMLVLPITIAKSVELSYETMTTLVVSSMFCFPIWFLGLPFAVREDELCQERNYYNREPDWRENDY